MTHPSNSQERCPRCGSRELEHERVRSQGIRIVSCLDCGAVFELSRSAGKKVLPTRRREYDPVDSVDRDDHEEELDLSDR